MKLILLLCLLSVFAADVKDPILRPPQQTVATRPVCAVPYGCVAYNSELKIFEGFNGTEWDAFGVSGIVEDSLVSTSTNNALSANQGRVLSEMIGPIEIDSHTHANKLLLDSLLSNGASNQFLSADGTYKTITETALGDVVGPAGAVADTMAMFDGITGKLLKSSPYRFPSVAPSTNQILQTGSGGNATLLSWVPVPTGNVAGPASAIDNNIVVYNGTSGKLLKDSTLIQATGGMLLAGTLASTPGTMVVRGVGATYSFKDSGNRTFGLRIPTNIDIAYDITFPAAKPIANQILRSDANGQLSWISPVGVVVDDTLVSTSTTNALSANQGRILDGKISTNTSSIAANTANISDNTAAINSNTGDIATNTSDIALLQTDSHTHVNKVVLDEVPSVMCADGEVLRSNGTNFLCTPILGVVEDSLISTSTVNALSANQGRILDEKILPLQTDSHVHANKLLLDSLTSTGTQGEFLASDGTYQLPIALTTWVQGKAYKAGEMVNSGSDANWLFKVIQDHTSVDVPADFRTGKIMAIAPPIITTGVQDGGEVSLAGTLATIQGGTGYIAKYGTSPSAWPLVTIVEWTTQNITVPATGIHALYIDEDGTLILGAPAGDTRSTQDDTISVAIVDMNLGLIYDRKTFPTNPVGQLRGLSVFLGVMTKGLAYVATGNQLSRSEHDIYFWGADPFNPYNPNKKTVPALPLADFYEFDQDGAVLPAVRITTLKNTVYDNGGNQVAMTNNRWTFIRIYSSPGSDNYVMYGQGQWQTEAEAKEAATSRNFIRPADLELTKFSAWFTFIKGDADFSDNIITVCEPFGCDKIGSTAGGGAGGIGDVVGPTSSVADNIPTFADLTGKVIKDSGKALASLASGSASGVTDNIVTFADATGKNLKDSGISVASIGGAFSNLGTVAAAGTATCPIAANRICYYTATGNHTVAFSGTPSNGMMFQIIVTGTAAYTITWPAMKWSGGTVVTSTKANAHSVFTVISTPGGYLVTGVEDLK